MQHNLDLPTCPICLSHFDNRQHIPKIIPSCGHSVCLPCLQQLLQEVYNPCCPLDKKPFTWEFNGIDSFPTNYLQRDLSKESGEYDICSAHQKKTKFICLNDQTLVCTDCLIFGHHKGHDAKPLSDFKEKMEQKGRELQAVSTALKSCRNRVSKLLETKEEGLRKVIQKKFEYLKFLLMTQELNLLSEVSVHISHHQNEWDQRLGMKSEIWKKAETKLAQQSSLLKNPQILDLIDEECSINEEEILEAFQKFSLDFERESNQIESIFREALEEQSLPTNTEALKSHIRQQLNSLKKNPQQENFENTLQKIIIPNTKFRITSQDETVAVSFSSTATEALLNSVVPSNSNNLSFQFDDLFLSPNDHFSLLYLSSFFNKTEFLTFETKDYRNSQSNLETTISLILEGRSLSLQGLNLSLNRGDIPLGLFHEIIPKLSSLKHLGLKLEESKIPDQLIEALIANTLPALNNLESFFVSFAQTKVSEEAIIELLENLPNVANIFLDFGKTSITDQALNFFSRRAIHRLNNLKQLEFRLWETRVQDVAIRDFFLNLPELNGLRLDFQGTCISDQSLSYLLESNPQLFKSLKHFDIDLKSTKISPAILTKIDRMTSLINNM